MSFVYAKASEGISFVDSQFINNVNGARNNGIVVGGYHFARPEARPTLVGARQEADHFMSVLQQGFGQGQYGDIFPVLDVETPYPRDGLTMSTSVLLRWINEFRRYFKERTGKTIMLYTAIFFIESYDNFYHPVPTGNPLLDMPLWIAHYPHLNPAQPIPPDRGGWSYWTVWQYTDQGSVAGISGNVDLNARPFSIEELQDSPIVSIHNINFNKQIYITDSGEKLKVILANEGESCSYYGGVHIERINGENRLEFSIPTDHPSSNKVVEGNLAYYRDFDNENQIQLFEIVRVVEGHKGELTKDVYCEHNAFELLDLYFSGFNAGEATFRNCMELLLGPSKWEVGIIQVSGTRTFGLKEIIQWEQYIRF